MSKHNDDNIIEYRGYGICIKPDEDPPNPRDGTMVGKMVCFHKQYKLGDKTDLEAEDFDGWDALRQHLMAKEGALVILPVRMYDHSGIILSTSTSYPFNDFWDSGQVGWIYATKETLDDTVGLNLPLSDEDQKKVVQYLQEEVAEYSDYVAGYCFRFSIVEKDGEEWGDEMDYDIGSCGGFIGFDREKSGLLEYAQNDIDAHVRSLEEQAKKPEYRVLFSKEMVVHADTEDEALTEAMAAFIKFAEGRFDRKDLGWLIKGPVPEQ